MRTSSQISAACTITDVWWVFDRGEIRWREQSDVDRDSLLWAQTDCLWWQFRVLMWDRWRFSARDVFECVLAAQQSASFMKNWPSQNNWLCYLVEQHIYFSNWFIFMNAFPLCENIAFTQSDNDLHACTLLHIRCLLCESAFTLQAMCSSLIMSV